MITIEFTNITNDSLQIGDLAYAITPSPSGGFNQSTNTPTFIGPITAITQTTIDVDETEQNVTPPVLPQANDFIMFAKDSSINISGLIGYYAEVKLMNNSTEKAEIFNLSSDISASSK